MLTPGVSCGDVISYSNAMTSMHRKVYVAAAMDMITS